MSWHWVGPGGGPLPRGTGVTIRSTIAWALVRNTALSAAVGAPVPPRALTMLSSRNVTNRGPRTTSTPLRVAVRRDDGVGVRAAAGLHVGDVAGVRDVGDVEDPDPAEPVVAHGVGDARVPQSVRPFSASPDTNSSVRYTETSLCDPGHTNALCNRGLLRSVMSHTWTPE